MLAEKVEKGRILSHGCIGIGRIVVGSLVVAEEYNDTFADKLLEFRSASDISFFAKHDLLYNNVFLFANLRICCQLSAYRGQILIFFVFTAFQFFLQEFGSETLLAFGYLLWCSC